MIKKLITQQYWLCYQIQLQENKFFQLRKKNAGESNALEMLESAQWSLDTSLKQQILPFYGFLGEKAVTIRGATKARVNAFAIEITEIE